VGCGHVEIVPKEHFHIVLETSLEIKEVKTNILTFLHMYWPDGQRPRGWVMHNITVKW